MTLEKAVAEGTVDTVLPAIADNHAVYKDGAEEIAAPEEMAITFMAKFNGREGNSCHIHCSPATADGTNALAADQGLFEGFAAGRLACMRELTLLYAPPSALIAAGLHGIDNELALEPAFEGNAYASDKPRVPHNIYDARAAAVTDWERYRGFERL